MKTTRTKTVNARVTMDGEELWLLERYEERFGETPPVYFFALARSKKLIVSALKRNRPFDEKDLVELGRVLNYARGYLSCCMRDNICSVQRIHAAIKA